MICSAAGWIRGCCLVAIEYAAGADGWAHYRPTQCSAGSMRRFFGAACVFDLFLRDSDDAVRSWLYRHVVRYFATTIAVCAGGLLARLTRPPFHHKIKHLVFFYYMASLHFCAAVVLEEPEQSWFLENASAPIAIFNFVSITIAAHLLDAEELKVTREYRLAASSTLNTDHGAMMKPAFVREIALRMSSRMMAPQQGWF